MAIKKINFKTYFTSHIIDADISGLPTILRLFTREYQAIVISLKNMILDKSMLMSSSLTYWTLLALVPFFALMFSVLKGMGVQNRLEPLILSKVGISSQEVVTKIIQYVDNTNVQSLGIIGFVALVFTVLSLLNKIERAFNIIWKVKKGRTLRRKFGDYLSIILVGPLLLLTAISLTTTLQSNVILQKVIGYAETPLTWLISFSPYMIMWCAFSLLYTFIPNTNVRLLPAIKAGILCGTLWQLAQWGYIHFQVGVSQYNAIYGAMAQLPVLLIWIYISWTILLFGVHLSASFQKADLMQGESLASNASFASQELLAIGLLTVIAGNFCNKCSPLTGSMLAGYFNVPVQLVNNIVARLIDTGFLEECAGDDPVFLPKQPLENITVRQIVEALKCYGTDIKFPKENIISHVEQHLNKINVLFTDALSQIKLKDLILPAKGLNMN